MKEEKLLNTLRKLEGLHTIETAMEAAGMKRQSTLNLLCRLKKEGYVTSSGGPRKHLYKIALYKQLPRNEGMFDILNKHNPHFQLSHWYDHQVHGRYKAEDALLDAIDTKSFRAILASLRLFSSITDWPYLYKEAKNRGSWQKVGALYDVARMQVRARKMPMRYPRSHFAHRAYLISNYPTHEERFLPIEKKWNVPIPFREGDLRKGGL